MKIYIDGENFRKGLEKILRESGTIGARAKLKRYDINGLLKDVLGANKLDVYYYSSRVKLPRGYQPSKYIVKISDDIKQEARVWLANVVQQDISLVKAGNLKVRESKSCHKCRTKQEILQEKGVDVRLAVDVLEDVYEKKLSPIVILSSDTDLCPVLHKATKKGIKIIYLCFANGLNRAISAVASETVSMSTDKVRQYYRKEN